MGAASLTHLRRRAGPALPSRCAARCNPTPELASSPCTLRGVLRQTRRLADCGKWASYAHNSCGFAPTRTRAKSAWFEATPRSEAWLFESQEALHNMAGSARVLRVGILLVGHDARIRPPLAPAAIVCNHISPLVARAVYVKCLRALISLLSRSCAEL